ncbi:MAG: hypothetical protein KQH63_00270 [Desulfobulbaceae bacterium]|nr:hypothetical protein [Desulfobulbaceae bacterium]
MKKIHILHKSYPFLILSLLLLMLPLSSGATELSMDGYSEITAPEVMKLFDQGRPVLIINVLSELEYDMQHINGSINIPITKMLTTKKLPKNLDTPLVFHCLSER